LGIAPPGVVVVVVPGAVAGGIPGDVVVVLGVVVPVAGALPTGAPVAAKAAPAPSAVSTTAKVAFLAAMFIGFLRLGARFPRYSANAARPTMFRIAPESPQSGQRSARRGDLV
jgi:hypothetical protein